MTHHILHDCRAGVLTLTLNRPEKRNALSEGMYQRLAEALACAVQEPTIHAALLLGQPGAFCSGNDVHSFMGAGQITAGHPVFAFQRALATCTKPVVAGVDGMAIGIGATLLLHCDLVFATPRSWMNPNATKGT